MIREQAVSIEKFLRHISQEPQHYYLGRIKYTELEDAMKEKICFYDGACDVFFTDWQPDANWGHSCSYWILTAKGFSKIDRDWPPRDKIKMTRIDFNSLTYNGFVVLPKGN